jgi:DNA-binding beta-propeller fold protein YncE
VIIADAENHLIRRYDPKTKGTETIAGTAVKGSKVASADAKQTELNRPHGVAVNRGGDLYVIDSYNNRVLRLR